MRAAMKRLAAAALATAALAAACGDVLEVKNPGPIPDEDLDRPDAVQSVVNGMSLDLSRAFDALTQEVAIMGDELFHGGSYTDEGLYNRGIIRFDGLTNTLWGAAHRARWVAESGIERLKTVLGQADFDKSPFVARAYVYAGLANRTLGENFCNAVIDGGPKQDFRVHFSRAEGQFTEAIRIANNLSGAVKDSLLRVAYGGRASVRAWQNKWADAAADAALVPTGYVFVAFFSLNRAIENNDLSFETQLTGGRREYTVFNTQWAAVRGDPRVPWDSTTALGQDGRTRFFRQTKYPNLDSDIPLVKGTEMLILRAEERLRAGDVAQAMALINQVRTFHRLPALTATTAAEAWPILQKERGATVWLESRRFWDLRRWNAEPAPIKNAYLDTRDKCIPISENEINANVNLRGG